MQSVGWQARTCVFRPFDQCRALIQRVVETEFVDLGFPFHSIKIEMAQP